MGCTRPGAGRPGLGLFLRHLGPLPVRPSELGGVDADLGEQGKGCIASLAAYPMGSEAEATALEARIAGLVGSPGPIRTAPTASASGTSAVEQRSGRNRMWAGGSISGPCSGAAGLPF